MPFQDKDQPQERVCLGKIVEAHGVKGLVKILFFGDDHTLLEQVEEHAITLKNQIGKYWLAEIEGISDREMAESLQGTELYLDKSKLPPIEEEGTYYIADMIGLKALDENGEEIGEVIAVDNFGAGDLIEIRPKSGEDFYVPFNKDHEPLVDLEKRTLCLKDWARFQNL